MSRRTRRRSRRQRFDSQIRNARHLDETYQYDNNIYFDYSIPDRVYLDDRYDEGLYRQSPTVPYTRQGTVDHGLPDKTAEQTYRKLLFNTRRERATSCQRASNARRHYAIKAMKSGKKLNKPKRKYECK